MLTVVQAFDRALIAEIATDDAAALKRKLNAAECAFKDCDGWLKPPQRMAILSSHDIAKDVTCQCWFTSG